jgi:hypothetical protein
MIGNGVLRRVNREFLVFSAVSVVLTCGTSLQGSSTGQGKGIPGVLVGDSPAPPASLDKYFEMVPMVLEAEVLSSGKPTVRQGGVVRVQKLAVTEAFKGAAGPGAEIFVLQFGGSAELDGKLHRQAYGATLFEPGQHLVLFLRPVAEPPGAYVVAWGPSGAFLLSNANSQIVVPPAARRLPQFSGRAEVPALTLIAELRRLRDQR